MVVVLKEAFENPELWRKEATCTGENWEQEKDFHPCYRLLEISALDVRKRTNHSYGDTETCYGFICPKCGCFTEINPKDIPYHIKSHARDYSKEEVDLILGKYKNTI